MVVDDDESIRRSLYKVLEGEGYQTILAANGPEAVELFQREQANVDLLLMDLNLPIKNGWVALNQIMEAAPSLPVFILTGLSHQDELAEAAGVSALVEKPVNVVELLSLIKRHVAVTLHAPAAEDSGQQEFTFYHVRAMRHIRYDPQAGARSAPYDHWGLNE
jgi:CheY-like chemotaxis protein